MDYYTTLDNYFSIQPRIPDGLLHGMYELQPGSVFSQEDGGQWIQGERKRVPFQGIVLPVTDKDLIRDASGTITHNTVKIYTNQYALHTGGQVEDRDGTVYTVTQELDHNSLHPMKRYLAECAGKAAVR